MLVFIIPAYQSEECSNVEYVVCHKAHLHTLNAFSDAHQTTAVISTIFGLNGISSTVYVVTQLEIVCKGLIYTLPLTLIPLSKGCTPNQGISLTIGSSLYSSGV